jgi:hypothetical protein
MATQDEQIAKAQEEVTKTRELVGKQVKELQDQLQTLQGLELNFPYFNVKIHNLIETMQGIANG